MKCYREDTCEVRLNGENRCNLRFKLDKCPGSLGDDDDEEMGGETGTGAITGEAATEEM